MRNCVAAFILVTFICLASGRATAGRPQTKSAGDLSGVGGVNVVDLHEKSFNRSSTMLGSMLQVHGTAKEPAILATAETALLATKWIVTAVNVGLKLATAVTQVISSMI